MTPCFVGGSVFQVTGRGACTPGGAEAFTPRSAMRARGRRCAHTLDRVRARGRRSVTPWEARARAPGGAVAITPWLRRATGAPGRLHPGRPARGGTPGGAGAYTSRMGPVWATGAPGRSHPGRPAHGGTPGGAGAFTSRFGTRWYARQGAPRRHALVCIPLLLDVNGDRHLPGKLRAPNQKNPGGDQAPRPGKLRAQNKKIPRRTRPGEHRRKIPGGTRPGEHPRKIPGGAPVPEFTSRSPRAGFRGTPGGVVTPASKPVARGRNS